MIKMNLFYIYTKLIIKFQKFEFHQEISMMLKHEMKRKNL